MHALVPPPARVLDAPAPRGCGLRRWLRAARPYRLRAAALAMLALALLAPVARAVPPAACADTGAQAGTTATGSTPVVVDSRSAPLDFSYRVLGSGPALSLVFNDGRDVFIQPLQPLQPAALRAEGLQHAVQGPYLVVSGLPDRIELSAGTLDARTIVEYRSRVRAETAALATRSGPPCEPVLQSAAASASPMAVDAVAAPAAAGATPALASALVPVAVPAAAPAPAPASAPAPAPASIPGSMRTEAAGSSQAGDAPAPGLAAMPAPELRLSFQPNHSVQSTLRHYLSAHGLAVEFRRMPVLMVEEFAEVSGADVREVLRRALSRLGLRGEIQGNRLLVVELAR